MSGGVTTIGLDADDTLWQSEQFYQQTEGRFAALLRPHVEAPEAVAERLLAAERRNLGLYGFGIKGFTLSMIETALEIGGEGLPARVIGEIVGLGREMLAHPIWTLPGVEDTLAILHTTHRLVLVTKGDLFDQERKLAASGLADLFSGVEIVSDKTAVSYARIFARHGDGPERAIMVGNSLKSDILPALEAGSFAAFVPHDLTFVLEHAEEPVGYPRFHRLAAFGELPALMAALSG